MKNKEKIILQTIMKDLNFYDTILLKMLKGYTIKIYTMGVCDEFNLEHKNSKKQMK